MIPLRYSVPHRRAPIATVAIIVASILTRQVKGKLPFTEEAFRTWRRGRIVFALAAFLGVLIGLASFAFLFAGEPALLAVGVACLLLAVLGPWGIHFRFLRGRNVVCREISKTHITLRIPNGAAAEELENHLRGVQLAPARATAP